MPELKSHFLPVELACTHCGKGTLTPGTLERLERARVAADMPMKVNSGFRCPVHNAQLEEAGLAEPNSAHMTGNAVDIAVHNSIERYKFLSAFVEAGFVRIGIGKTFLHVDDDEKKPQNCIWVY